MDYFLEFYRSVSGEVVDATELLLAGERVWNLQRELNARLGFGREQDEAPDVWFVPLKTGDGETPLMDYYQQRVISRRDTEEMLDDYYDARGWDAGTGNPSKGTLKVLGLGGFR